DRGALVKAVALAAQNRLAAAMVRNAPTPEEEPDAGRRAVLRLRGIGRSYIRFALSEPGWFELAFLTQNESRAPEAFAPDDAELAPPFRLLLDALDDMAGTGLLSPAQRRNAEWVCWAAVHGFADLATRGPLQGQDHAVIDQLADGVVDAVIAGLQAKDGGAPDRLPAREGSSRSAGAFRPNRDKMDQHVYSRFIMPVGMPTRLF
ncbi:MAG TPA: TetR-like C-terminal domain-containing protein, partial [Micrococcaceae bacterium]